LFYNFFFIIVCYFIALHHDVWYSIIMLLHYFFLMISYCVLVISFLLLVISCYLCLSYY